MDDQKMKEAMKDIIDKLSDGQKEKAMACENMDEFMKLADEWGLELPDELVTGVAGGGAKLMNDDLLKMLIRSLKLP